MRSREETEPLTKMTINLYEGEKLWKETDNQENTELLNLARKKRGQKGLLFFIEKVMQI